MYSYATLNQIKTLITDDIANLSQAVFYTSEYERQIMAFARLATARIRRDCNRAFEPSRYTWTPNRRQLDQFYNRTYQALIMPHDLLELISVTFGQDSPTPASEFDVFAELPNYPYSYVARKTGSWFGGDGDFAMLGIWGYREDYERDGWYASGQELGAGITAFDTVIPLSDTSPFSVGAIGRLGSEYVAVVGVTDDDIKIRRGELGTPATLHDEDTPIDLFSVEPDIVRACAKLVEANLSNIGNMTRITVTDMSAAQTIYIPEEVQAIINQRRRKFAIGGW